MENPIVEVNNVSMMFRLYRENVDSLKEFLIKKVKRQITYEEFWALSDWAEWMWEKYAPENDCRRFKTYEGECAY